jgi:hypothetical protein
LLYSDVAIDQACNNNQPRTHLFAFLNAICFCRMCQNSDLIGILVSRPTYTSSV